LSALVVGGAVVGVIMLKEKTLPLVSYFLLRIMLSGILAWIAFACVMEMYRLWFVRTVSLGPFAYVKDGAETKDTGALFAQEVNHDLQIIHQLLKGEPSYRPPGDDGKVRAETISALARESSSLGDIEIPALSNTMLADLEIQIQGVKVTELFRTLTKLIHPPDEVVGMVSERNGRISAQVELRHGLTWSRPGLPSQEAHDHENRSEASFAIGCRILYLLAADRNESILKTYSPEELELYLRGLRQFSLYSVLRAEARFDSAKKQEAALAEADRVLGKLTADKTKLDPAYKLAALVALARGDGARGEALLHEYMQRLAASPTKPIDPAAQRLQAVVKPKSPKEFDPRRKDKVRPGLSASSVKAGAGTICCMVKDKSGGLYLLSSEHPFAGEPGTEVVQPSVIDGGSAPKDVVAQVVKSIPKPKAGPQTAAGTIAKLRSGVEYEPATSMFAFAGVGSVQPGDAVRMIGRTSGITQGIVTAVNVSVEIGGMPEPPGTAKFDGLVSCSGTGMMFSQAGDSGAPVVNAKNELVGMLYAGSNDLSYFIPIQPILEALEVDLVK
jgi:hypothetical protein